MKLNRIKATVILLSMLLVIGSGCTQQKPNEAVPKNTEPATEATQPQQTATDTFQEGVMVDLSAYENEHKFTSLLQTLENNMKAMVEKDAVAFEKTFLSKKDFEDNRFFLESQDKYQFVGKPQITEQEDLNRIDVGVRYRVKKSGSSEDFKETGIMYNFKQDSSGEWKIILID